MVIDQDHRHKAPNAVFTASHWFSSPLSPRRHSETTARRAETRDQSLDGGGDQLGPILRGEMAPQV
ncbi:hypothetical protein CQW49_11010 [Methylosinus trichosporium OB3b]|uniref:Uncharacterized protein n=1 Tax=Methylosinus trichosporium (strain ATCC 35070 / NCIMB 11131 / UNIQEM 75 / OB3b) TaxID=595536 RepID=A0A2D2D063_METT3|nr:hypothetical protein CQW49_11010 [Methylosinus trichosporium OB3b]OBS50910.1 hypothetical protein A8B73_18650 [Methylosinus sp. 3S-1]